VTPAASQGADAPEFTEPAPQSRAAPAGVLDEVSNVVAAARRTVSGFFELLTLEARRAGLALAWMVALGTAAALLGVTAWLGIVTTLVLCVMALGVTPILAVLLFVVLNIAGAAAAVYVCMNMSKDLMFPSSRRQLAAKVDTPAPQP